MAECFNERQAEKSKSKGKYRLVGEQMNKF